MNAQNYKNHRKFYAPHHFIYLPALLVLFGYGIYKRSADEENELLWTLFSGIIFLILYLAIMVRQHYALVLQDRMVVIEFRQRYFELFGKRSDDIVSQLNFSQIAALRFAYDDEFKTLIERALNENISGDEIKKSITNWRPDLSRV
ncbi:hypothetical protein ASG01_08680 [Chryseobacterium sp. Leaf180]|uniref:DUF6526 family protein n=1 Tax=Chryseobacterium sp. Leaf180 TaxID=1736289 RepID=UPI0006FF3D7C|nr:DUF6526 family protein [Chryseobacterium sp. Leaf180]KQR93263.1 hypothetical protein ASG01_08680 [Chryseobacterium sp. Leaf180]